MKVLREWIDPEQIEKETEGGKQPTNAGPRGQWLLLWQLFG